MRQKAGYEVRVFKDAGRNPNFGILDRATSQPQEFIFHKTKRTNFIEDGVINLFPRVLHGFFRVSRGDYFVLSRRVLVGGQDSDFTTRDLLFVNHDDLYDRHNTRYKLQN